VSGEITRVMRENDELAKELRDLRARVAAMESSRWWRLHPRVAVRNLRSRFDGTGDSAAPEHEASRSHAFPLDFGEADAQICRRVAPYTMTTPPRIYALVRAVEYASARAIPGAFVECGVWRGGSMMAVALTLLRLGITDRELYLYDTFSGMTAPSEKDVKYSGESAADLLETQSPDSDVWAIASIDQVREVVQGVGYPPERIHLVQGPVEETVPIKAPDEIALLRLDTDWYASTKHELVHLYPRLASGGVLILDDYGYWQGARLAVDEFLAENDVRLLLNRVDNTARMAVKP
jgi:O-methyltransferase